MFIFYVNGTELEVHEYDMGLDVVTIRIAPSMPIKDIEDLLSAEPYEFSILDEFNAGFTLSTNEYVFDSVKELNDEYEITYKFRKDKSVTQEEKLQGQLDYLAIMLDVDLNEV